MQSGYHSTIEQTSWRELPSIIAAPEREAEYDAWLAGMVAHRERAAADLRLAEAPIADPRLAWMRECWVCAKWMTWDRRFLSSNGLEFLADKFVEDGKRRFGGYDGVVLWQAYPRIGFDTRNQFDLYRELPGGLEGLRKLGRDLRDRGVRVFVDYNPWDVGTRREGKSDAVLLRDLVDAIDADGVFLDTLRSGSSELSEQLLKSGKPMALESELDLPPTALADHALSWMQWPNPPDLLGVLRNRWLSPGHMMHSIRRWHRDHFHELALAWLNGVGLLVWENVFASWNGWRQRDAEMLAQMRRFYGKHRRFFLEGEWRPLVPSHHPGLKVSEWSLEAGRVWTVVNPTSEFLEIPLSEPLFDGFGGRTGFSHTQTIPPMSLAAWTSFATDGVGSVAVESFVPGPIVRHIPERAPGHPAPEGMVRVNFAGGVVSAKVRVRECGDYAYANFENKEYPGLHQTVPIQQQLPAFSLAIDAYEVTNREFAEFLAATRYQPKFAENFLLHWDEGRPTPGDEDGPVVFVDLDDARAFAEWKGKRLPTEWEWQVAAAGSGFERRNPLVWNLTESGHTDGISEFVMLKGGCETKVVGSDWYADGGLQAPEFSAKFLRIWPGLDRCATVGFRCGRDLTSES